MKEDENLKTILDFRIDNMRQERELFKHIAILSSAIVGIFLSNSNRDIGPLAVYSIIGFILVIIISVILLYIILKIDQKQAISVQNQMQNIKQIKNDAIKSAIIKILNKDSLLLIKDLIDDKDLDKFSSGLAIVGFEFYGEIIQGDNKIKEEMARNKDSKKLNLALEIVSVIGVSVFVLSLVLALFDVLGMHKIF